MTASLWLPCAHAEPRAQTADPDPSAGAPPTTERLRAGLGVAPLPARIGAPLGGYGGLWDRIGRSVHDAPQARALLLERGATRVAVLTLDVVIPRSDLRSALLARSEALDLDALLLAATHTHSGPGGYIEGFLAERITAGSFDPAIREGLLDASERALASAQADLRSVGVRAAEADLELAEHRRIDGGPRETALPLLRLDPLDPAAQPIVLLAYGAHPTVLSPASHAFSADYVGPLRDALERAGLRPLFLAGPMGDQRAGPDRFEWPIPFVSRPSELERAREIGGRVASAVLEALDATAASDDQLTARELELELPPFELRRGCALWWLSPWVREPAAQLISKRAPLQLVQIGAARLLALPAEPGVELGDRFRAVLEREFPSSVRFVVAHANDWIGYVVTEATYERGGYEACLSFHGPQLGPWLVDRAGELAAAPSRPAAAAPIDPHLPRSSRRPQ